MAKKPAAKPQTEPTPNQTQQSPQKLDVNTLIAALRAAEEKNSELIDLIARLNRSLRQLEEQNRVIAERLQADQPKS